VLDDIASSYQPLPAYLPFSHPSQTIFSTPFPPPSSPPPIITASLSRSPTISQIDPTPGSSSCRTAGETTVSRSVSMRTYARSRYGACFDSGVAREDARLCAEIDAVEGGSRGIVLTVREVRSRANALASAIPSGLVETLSQHGRLSERIRS
jgi:hypothetical protein